MSTPEPTSRTASFEDRMTAIPDLDSEKCTGCGECVESCPTGAVELVDGRATVVRPEDCDYCTDCEAICVSGAIRCPFEIVLFTGHPSQDTE